VNLRRYLVALAAGAILVAAGGCDNARPFALEVDGTEVAQSSVNRELGALADNEALAAAAAQAQSTLTNSDGTLNSGSTAYWLTLRAEQEVIDRQVRRRHLEVTTPDRDAGKEDIDREFGAEVFGDFPKWLQDRLVDRYARRNALERDIGGEVALPTDDEVRAAYDEVVAQQKAQCTSGRFVSHILVETQAQADALAAELVAGADFATLARENSVEGSSADGGELGCFDPAQLVPEFSTAASALAPGAVSAPVQTEFGFHLIKISDTIPLAAIEPGIRRQLERQAAALGNPELNKLVAESEVKIDPRYGTWKVEEGVGRVRPPKGATAPTTSPAPEPVPPPPPPSP